MIKLIKALEDGEGERAGGRLTPGSGGRTAGELTFWKVLQRRPSAVASHEALRNAAIKLGRAREGQKKMSASGTSLRNPISS